jgi:hypothetical protein
MSVSSSGAITTTGNVAGTASYASNAELLDGLDSTVFTLTSSFAAQTASFTAFTASQNILNGTYATTGSNTFTSPQTINSNLVVTGSITAQTLVVQTITSSVDFVTGSTRFGSLAANTHVFTGSLLVSGSTHSMFGNVVLGNTSSVNASARLEVKGDLFLTPSSSISSILHLYNKDSTNETYIYDSGSSSNSALTFAPGGTTRMTINSAGNIGIGTISPTTKLTIDDTGVYGSALNLVEGTFGAWVQGSTEGLTHAFIGNFKYNFTTPASSYSYYSGTGFGIDMCDGIKFFSAQSGVSGGTFTPTERVRITAGGSLCINATSSGGGNPYFYNYNGDSSRINAVFEVSVATPGFTSIIFKNPNGTQGSIAINTATVSYNTTSDYRLKENLKEINGLEKVCAIKIYNYKWKSCDERMDGVLAHELAEVIPYAVTGEKDAEQMQAVDYSKLVPILTKAIQELKAEIDELKNR